MITGQPLRIKYLQRAIAEMQKNDAVYEMVTTRMQLYS